MILCGRGPSCVLKNVQQYPALHPLTHNHVLTHRHTQSRGQGGRHLNLAWPFLEHSECYGNGDVTKLSNKTQSWAFDLSNEVTEVAYTHRTTGGRLTNFHKGSF